MAPPKKKKEDLCTESLTIYLTPKEKANLKTQAFSKELYMSDYVKMLVKEDAKNKQVNLADI